MFVRKNVRLFQESRQVNNEGHKILHGKKFVTLEGDLQTGCVCLFNKLEIN